MGCAFGRLAVVTATAVAPPETVTEKLALVVGAILHVALAEPAATPVTNPLFVPPVPIVNVPVAELAQTAFAVSSRDALSLQVVGQVSCSVEPTATVVAPVGELTAMVESVATVILVATEAVLLFASVTRTVNAEDPVPVGVPVKLHDVPAAKLVQEPIVIPVGNEPTDTVYVYGACPPEAATLPE